MFIDCDLASDMKYFPFLVNTIEAGYDFATGLRCIECAKVRRSMLRYFTSRVYDLLIRATFKTGISDH